MTWSIDPAHYALGLLDGCDLARARQLKERNLAFAAESRALAAVSARLSTLDADEWDGAAPPPLRSAANRGGLTRPSRRSLGGTQGS